jgi:predicted DNA-binding protein
MVELHLESEAESLLEHFAAQAGQTKAEIARRAVLEFLEDREDYEAGVAALKASEGQSAISLEEVVQSLGLESEFSGKSTEAIGESGSSGAKANPPLHLRKASRVA